MNTDLIINLVFKDYLECENMAKSLAYQAGYLLDKVRAQEVQDQADLYSACLRAYKYLVRAEGTRPDPMSNKEKLMFQLVKERINDGISKPKEKM